MSSSQYCYSYGIQNVCDKIEKLHSNRSFDQIRIFTIAANHGNLGAIIELALYYQEVNDVENMVKYLKLSADNDIEYAIFTLAEYYKSCNKYLEAVKYEEILYNKGYDELAYDLGLIYEILGDYKKMIEYYDIAIENENDLALQKIIEFYANSDHYDIDNLIKYMRIGVQREDGLSAYILASYYENNGDILAAKIYYTKAYEYGYLEAEAKLKKLSNKNNVINSKPHISYLSYLCSPHFCVIL